MDNQCRMRLRSSPSPLRRAMSSSHPQAFSSLSSVSALGICFPDSILAIVGCGTPDFSAS
ncbi:MAG: hypothetical protein QOD63_2010 [Actinomycetota bacterium]|nr:hypothetical protein [Actinomycetota bacterium]